VTPFACVGTDARLRDVLGCHPSSCSAPAAERTACEHAAFERARKNESSPGEETNIAARSESAVIFGEPPRTDMPRRGFEPPRF
jgi:hypothetical protein